MNVRINYQWLIEDVINFREVEATLHEWIVLFLGGTWKCLMAIANFEDVACFAIALIVPFEYVFIPTAKEYMGPCRSAFSH